MRNFSVFAGCGIVYSLLSLAVVSQVSGVNIYLFITSVTEFVFDLSIALAVITAMPLFIPERLVPEKLRSVLILGFAAPPVTLVLVAIVSFLHLGPLLKWIFWPAVVAWLVYGCWREKKNPAQSAG